MVFTYFRFILIIMYCLKICSYFLMSNTQKAVTCQQCSAFVYIENIHKKSGTALLLFRFTRLSHCLLFRTSNTEAHANMYAHIHTLMVRMEIDIHIPRTSKCCNVLKQIRICEIRKAKT